MGLVELSEVEVPNVARKCGRDMKETIKISLEADVSVFFISHIQKAILKSTADRDVANLVRCALPVS